VVRVSASASLSVDVAAVVVEREVIVREVTDVVMLERAKKVHHLESSLLNSVADLDEVLDVVELLLPLKFGIYVQLAFASAEIPLHTLLGWAGQ